MSVVVRALPARNGGDAFDSPATALFSALLYAVYPLAIQVGMHLYYQVPMNLILIWLVLCLLSPATWRNGLETGLAVGLSALAQPVTLPLLAILPLLRIRPPDVVLLLCRGGRGGDCALDHTRVRGISPVRAHSQRRAGHSAARLDRSLSEYDHRGGASGDATRRAVGERMHSRGRNEPFGPFQGGAAELSAFLAKKFLMAWYNTEGKAKNRLCLLIQGPFLALAVLGLALPRGMWLKNRNWYLPAMVLYFCAVEMALLPLVRYTLAVMPLVMVPAGIGGALPCASCVAVRRQVSRGLRGIASSP